MRNPATHAHAHRARRLTHTQPQTLAQTGAHVHLAPSLLRCQPLPLLARLRAAPVSVARTRRRGRGRRARRAGPSGASRALPLASAGGAVWRERLVTGGGAAALRAVLRPLLPAVVHVGGELAQLFVQARLRSRGLGPLVHRGVLQVHDVGQQLRVALARQRLHLVEVDQPLLEVLDLLHAGGLLRGRAPPCRQLELLPSLLQVLPLPLQDLPLPGRHAVEPARGRRRR